jgi:thiamine biosynthesis lipoprotein
MMDRRAWVEQIMGMPISLHLRGPGVRGDPRTAAAVGEVFAYCLNAGGDIAVHVASPSRPAWRVGIEDPHDRRRLLDVRTIRTGSVATSGTAARGAHIIDSRRGVPATDLLSATVTGPSLLWADVYATTAFAQGPGAESWLRYRAPDNEITPAL